MATAATRLAITVVVLAASACGGQSTPPDRVSGYSFAATPAGHDGPAAGCVVCHSLEKNGPLRVAPTLYGIVGAEKARFTWYGYSRALAEAGGKWTEQDLEEYLTDPDKFLPGTKKTLVGLPDADERGKLIAYLKDLKD